jgi:putative ABC transport system permease protein
MIRRLGGRARAGWRALTGSASTAAAALGLLVCLCTLLAVVGPRADAEVRTDAFRQVIANAQATDKAVIGTVSDATLGAGQSQGLDARLIARTRAQLHANLATLPLSPARTDWSSLTTPFLTLTGYGPSAMAQLRPQLELSYRDALARNVQVIAGRLPRGTVASGSAVILQAAATEATARRFGLRVGSRLGLPGTTFVVTVTGIVQPRDPAAPFWTIDPVVAAPQLENPDTHPYWQGGVFIPAAAVAALQNQINGGVEQVTWLFPLSLGRLTAAQATQLQSTLTGALSTAGRITMSGSAGGAPVPVLITLTSGTGQLIASFLAVAAGVGSVLDLLSVSLAVLAAVVVLLAGWLLAERRRQELAVLRARGASRRQLAQTVLASTAVPAVPGAVAGAAIAVALTPSSPVVLSWWLAGLVVVAALAGPVVLTIRTHRGYAAPERPDATPARLLAVRRLIIEAGLVAGAAGGLAVLRYKGLAATGDFYASAAPVLLAIGVAVVMVRVYPLLVRGTLRLRGQRASAATFLGLARAARASASAALPAFALVLALALVSFAGMVRGAVQRAEVAASWQEAGADAVITEPGTISAALQRAVAAVPGVQHVAAADVGTATAPGGRLFYVLAVDPDQYAALLAGSPLPALPPAFTAGAKRGTVPALVAPGLAAQFGHGPVGVLIGGRTIQARVVGQAASMSALSDLSDDYLVLPRQALTSVAPPPTTLLVRGPDLNPVALAAAVARYGQGATVVLRSRLAAALRRAPLQRGAYVTLALGAVAAACCGLLVLLLSLLLSASARRLALARMSTMGLSAGQARLLAVMELLPQLLAVLAGGLGSAAALVPLIGPALNLGSFGAAGSVAVRVEPEWLVVAGAGLVVLALLTLSGQTMLTDRTAAGSLRMGE